MQVPQAAMFSLSQLPPHMLQWPACMPRPGARTLVERCCEVGVCLCCRAAACRAGAQHPCCSGPRLQEQISPSAARRGTHRVAHVACRFLVTYMCAPAGGQPVVITDLMRDWPALERWQDLDYLSR